MAIFLSEMEELAISWEEARPLKFISLQKNNNL
jgi:hypothetical protein